MMYILNLIYNQAQQQLSCNRQRCTHLHARVPLFRRESSRRTSRLSLVVVYGRKMYVYLGDDTRRIVSERVGVSRYGHPSMSVSIIHPPDVRRGTKRARRSAEGPF